MDSPKKPEVTLLIERVVEVRIVTIPSKLVAWDRQRDPFNQDLNQP